MLRAHTFAILISVAQLAYSQGTLETMPRYDRYERLRREIFSSIKPGATDFAWADDSKSFTYKTDGKFFKIELAHLEPVPTETTGKSASTRNRRQNPERGRQFDTAYSADGKWKAVTRDRNVYISQSEGKTETIVTTDGSATARTKYGIASWVYGEELGVREAMWWSPDSSKLAYYKFDESEVKDFYLAYSQSKIQDTLDVEAYPKAGAPNPKVALYVYDRNEKKSVQIEVTFGDKTLGEYVYDVRWSPDGKWLLYNRTNRKQNVMEFCAADPLTGKSHTIISEKQPQSWADNHPQVQFLKDNRHFIWGSEKNGFINLYLADFEGGELKPITQLTADVLSVVKFDEDKKTIWYMSAGPQNPYHQQLHRVSLDGKGDRQLTDSTLGHSIVLSPDGQHFIDVAQSSTTPAEVRLCDESGKVLKVVAKSDTAKFDSLKLKQTEVFTYLAADGKTTLYGTLQFPSDFDPSKKYPVIVNVYGGPESAGINAGFQAPSPLTELGFLVANFAGRGTSGRGKGFRDAVYEKLGIVEIDDQAAGAKALAERPYVDGKRIGIQGTSYGGYSTIMCVLRHPEVFAVGVASSSVTQWLNYDSIYTERYMGMPTEDDNKAGYENGSAMKYAKNLSGRLMLYYGTADNNVHPNNTMQLVVALENEGKRFDMYVGPDRGHTAIPNTRMLEFFIQNLVTTTAKDAFNKHFDARQRALRSARK